jgi:hypothetical protein
MLRQRHGSFAKDSDDDDDDVEQLVPRRLLHRSLSAGRQGLPSSPSRCRQQENDPEQQRHVRSAATYKQHPQPSLRCTLRLLLLLSFLCFGLFPLVIMVLVSVFSPLKVFLLGNGYTTSGGLLGDLVDRHLAAKYRSKLHRMAINKKLLFPDVTIKATRKTEPSHYSRYLEEILRRHRSTTATVNVSTTMAVAAIDETAAQQPHYWQNHQHHHQRSTSSSSSSASSSRRVQVHGDNALLATIQVAPSVKDLRAEDCTSNWLCQRCLNTAFFGTYAKCKAFCRQCYIRILSTVPHIAAKDAELVVSLTTTQGLFANNNNDHHHEDEDVNRRRIPKIVHQAWLRYPRTLEYPEFARLQTRWRSVGSYEYHFYTAEQEKLFIQEHYPVVVSTAYDKIVESSHRRDFFKLLVLYKVGGVYANGKYVEVVHSLLLLCVCVPLSLQSSYHRSPTSHW